MLRLFISRPLNNDSLIRKWADSKNAEVIDQSLLRFTALAFNYTTSDHDWLFFYSPRGVNFFMANVEASTLQNIKLAAIGKGTASTIAQYQLQVDFIGSGDPKETAEAFQKTAEGKRVLFISAQQSQRSIERLVKDQMKTSNLAVYRNEIVPPSKKILADILIFTSSLNAKSWFTTHTVNQQQKVIAIGSSTAKTLREFGINAPYPKHPKEVALVALLDNIV